MNTLLLKSISIVSLLTLVVLSGSLSAQQTTRGDENWIMAGIARQPVTPDPAIRNWVTGEPYGKIHDSLFVTSLALGSGAERVVLISWPLVDAGESAVAELKERAAQQLHIDPNRILVSATHNHSAPWSPVYKKGLRGKEVDPWWAIRYMPPQYDYRPYNQWMELLMVESISAIRGAIEKQEMTTMWLGRSDISSVVQNRRPRPANWGILDSRLPERYNYKHPDWDPDVLGDGKTFGALDRAMTSVFFENEAEEIVATLVHLTAHAVSIYPFMDGISADWPGALQHQLKHAHGMDAIVLQGTAGDVNPARRGHEAVNDMVQLLIKKVKTANKYAARLETSDPVNIIGNIDLPLSTYGSTLTGLSEMPANIQVVAIGPLALVTLPGEPMTQLGQAIREKSPYPQTLVLGYSNGKGVYYVGMPGEKKHGGYEVGEKNGLGNEKAGEILVFQAIELLNKTFDKK